jgi:hypothetical protein
MALPAPRLELLQQSVVPMEVTFIAKLQHEEALKASASGSIQSGQPLSQWMSWYQQVLVEDMTPLLAG